MVTAYRPLLSMNERHIMRYALGERSERMTDEELSAAYKAHVRIVTEAFAEAVKVMQARYPCTGRS